MSIRNDIIRWLEQNVALQMKDRKSREALLFRASLDQALESGIELEGNAGQFCPLLVKTLSEYGKMNDGRYASEGDDQSPIVIFSDNMYTSTVVFVNLFSFKKGRPVSNFPLEKFSISYQYRFAASYLYMILVDNFSHIWLS